MASDFCEDCGAGDVRVRLGDTPLCDRCADRRVAELTGLPELGLRPAPFVLTGPDGRRHHMQPRPWRAPTGIVVELDVRPDAEVVSLAPRQPSSPLGGRQEEATGPSIDAVLSEFLAAQEQRLAARTFGNYLGVIDLLRHCLNGYGHQYLDDDERRRYEEAFNAGDEDAFVHLFGPEKIVDGLDEFLDYFMVRKVMAGEDLLRAAGTVTKKLAKWMAASGYLDAATAEEAVDRGTSAARDLPRAERLSRLLFEQAERDAQDHRNAAGDDVQDDYFTIERVEPGALWLSGGVGPVKVSKEASSLAQPGWSVYLVLVRSGRGWRVIESGNVYP